jgi:tetratricopeptide (TPR) repeat protein
MTHLFELRVSIIDEKARRRMIENEYKLIGNRGVKLYKEGKLKEAIVEWKKIPEESVYYKKIQKYITRVEEKISNIKTPEQIENEKKALAHLKKADVFMKLNDYENAKKELEIVIELFPDNKEAYCQLGKIYFEQGDYRAALVNIRKALSIDAEYEEALEIERVILERTEKDRSIWMKEDSFYAKAKLVYEDFNDEKVILKFAPESGTFNRVIAGNKRCGQWDLEIGEENMVLQNSIRLPDLSRFKGIKFLISSENISKVNIVLVEYVLDMERTWEVLIPGIKKDFQVMTILFRYFSAKGRPGLRIDLSSITKIKVVVKPEFIETGVEEAWIRLDDVEFYK